MCRHPAAPGVHVHDLKSTGLRVRLLPQAPAGVPDLDGRTTSHKLMVVAQWNDELESHLLSIMDLMVVSRGRTVLSTDLFMVCTWEAPAITDIHVAELGSPGSASGEVLLTAGTARGGLLAGRLVVPRTMGGTPEQLQLTTLHTDDASAALVPSLPELHAGAVASVDVQPETQAILTVGADGAIHILSPEIALAGPGQQHQQQPFATSPSGCISYCNGRWTGSTTFVTVGVLGGLQVWDTRAGPKPVASSPAAWGLTGSGTGSGGGLASSGPACCYWLHAHPSRPGLVASGATGGEVAVWDVRLTAAPLVARVPDPGDGADVWEVRFDPSQAGGRGGDGLSSSVLFCSDGGLVGAAGPGGKGVAPLWQGCYSVASFDVEPQLGADVVAVTDGQELVYIARDA